MFLLNDKVALITGATGAIGYEVAKTLHKQGATIAVTGTNVSLLEQLSSELNNERVHCFACNLFDQIEQLIPNVERVCGKIDILVNNAGITRDQMLLRMSDEAWSDVITVNLEAPFKLMRAATKSMLKNRYGRIINISSVVAISGNAGQANYCASKAGVIGMSKAIAREFAMRNITVNCIAPGFIESKMTEALSKEARENMEKSIPIGRMGVPQDVASAVVFLASDESSYITGQTIHVNGGMVME